MIDKIFGACIRNIQPNCEPERAASDDELAVMFSDRARRALEYVDDLALASSSAKDLLISAGVATDKMKLLRGEATSVVRIEDDRKLDELAVMLHDEIQRRQNMIDVTPERVDESKEAAQVTRRER